MKDVTYAGWNVGGVKLAGSIPAVLGPDLIQGWLSLRTAREAGVDKAPRIAWDARFWKPRRANIACDEPVEHTIPASLTMSSSRP